MSLKMCDSSHLCIWRSIQYTRTCVQLYIAKIALHKMLQYVMLCPFTGTRGRQYREAGPTSGTIQQGLLAMCMLLSAGLNGAHSL